MKKDIKKSKNLINVLHCSKILFYLPLIYILGDLARASDVIGRLHTGIMVIKQKGVVEKSNVVVELLPHYRIGKKKLYSGKVIGHDFKNKTITVKLNNHKGSRFLIRAKKISAKSLTQIKSNSHLLKRETLETNCRGKDIVDQELCADLEAYFDSYYPSQPMYEILHVPEGAYLKRVKK